MTPHRADHAACPSLPPRGLADIQRGVAVLALLVGLVWPWIQHPVGTFSRGPLWIADEVHWALIGSGVDVDPSRWWWGLPLLYALVVPALWSPRRRASRRYPLLVGLWSVGVFAVVALIAHCATFSREWDWDPGLGIVFTVVGALLVGTTPLVERLRMGPVLAHWRARPGAALVGEDDLAPDDGATLQRLSVPLRRTIERARVARAELSPLLPIEGESLAALADVVTDLRTIDARGRAELRDHGLDAHALLQALAPEELPDEGAFAELLRVDAALARLDALGRSGPRRPVYR